MYPVWLRRMVWVLPLLFLAGTTAETVRAQQSFGSRAHGCTKGTKYAFLVAVQEYDGNQR